MASGNRLGMLDPEQGRSAKLADLVGRPGRMDS